MSDNRTTRHPHGVCQHSTHSSNAQLQQYLTERESYSANLNRQSHWVGTSAAFAAHFWSLWTRSLRSRAFAIRILWEKGMHGDNRSKGSAYTPEQNTFNAFLQCTGIRTQWITGSDNGPYALCNNARRNASPPCKPMWTQSS